MLPFLSPWGGLMSAPGVRRTLRVAAPAAGLEWQVQIPGGERWWVLAGFWTLTASGVAANRLSGVDVLDADNQRVWSATSPTAVALLGVGSISFASGANPVTGAAGGVVLPLPEWWLPPGYRLGSRTVALDAGDQVSAINLEVFALALGEDGPVEGRPDAYLSALASQETLDA